MQRPTSTPAPTRTPTPTPASTLTPTRTPTVHCNDSLPRTTAR